MIFFHHVWDSIQLLVQISVFRVPSATQPWVTGLIISPTNYRAKMHEFCSNPSSVPKSIQLLFKSVVNY